MKIKSSLPTQVGEVVGDILVCDVIFWGRRGCDRKKKSFHFPGGAFFGYRS